MRKRNRAKTRAKRFATCRRFGGMAEDARVEAKAKTGIAAAKGASDWIHTGNCKGALRLITRGLEAVSEAAKEARGRPSEIIQIASDRLTRAERAFHTICLRKRR